MRYLSLTDADREAMLAEIGVDSVDELFREIPEGVRFHGRLDLEPALPQRVADGEHGLVERERLLDEVERAELRGFDRGRNRRMSGNHHDGQRVVRRLDPLQHLEPVHARHLDVEEREVDRLASE